jgi:hypothetical protein
VTEGMLEFVEGEVKFVPAWYLLRTVAQEIAKRRECNAEKETVAGCMRKGEPVKGRIKRFDISKGMDFS